MNMSKKENRLIVGSWQWADTIPEWLLDEVRKERLVLGLIAINVPDMDVAGKIGDAELLVYLSTASLQTPLPHNLTEIYLYLTTKIMDERGSPVPDDIRKTELTNDCQRELRELKSMIYDKRGGDIQHPILNAMRQFKKDCCKMELPQEKTLFDLPTVTGMVAK